MLSACVRPNLDAGSEGGGGGAAAAEEEAEAAGASRGLDGAASTGCAGDPLLAFVPCCAGSCAPDTAMLVLQYRQGPDL
eukprot:CAMPEP_0172029746 /NCGR_PEP_ID=MMETSP1041-20130122/18313_1 /TAXON_ID=464988 /ORGANISM="Hemiselmis andersenii, Strain CCMP439" /LENGTH=78 /DNA_ID=CAMNT_0012685965 /DNA_START=209 /DNA_END=443 /DNA_ORIENTATION=+